jgi:hypothetical protein
MLYFHQEYRPGGRNRGLNTERSLDDAQEVFMKKNILLSCLLLLLFSFPSIAADKRIAVPAGDSPSMGPENAPVTIIEFIDFQ